MSLENIIMANLPLYTLIILFLLIDGVTHKPSQDITSVDTVKGMMKRVITLNEFCCHKYR